ncbi:ESPR-type extended signal peptide-containing protein [Collimonas fungivorans]|nr:ESPR-type extended signal peptide-containing protein [Collimonas fungivorans]
MNKIHSKVWSPARNQFVVASEIAACPRGGAPGQGGRRALLRSRSPAVFAALVASGWLGWASLAQAQAQAVDCSTAPYNFYNGTASCMGFQSAATGVGATALGSLAHANVLGGLAVGYNALSNAQNGISLGFQAYTNAINSIYLGARTAAGTGALAGGAIGIGTDVTASGPNSVALGTLAIGAGTNSVAVANSSSVDANSVNSIAIGYLTKVTNSNNAVALGSGSLVSGGTHGTAVGWQAYASALNAVYLGARTAGTGASAESAVGIGTDVSASGIYSIGMGLGAKASQGDAIAIGRQAVATGINSIYLGSLQSGIAGSGATANNAIAVGTDITASGVGALALGNFTVASGVNSVALGASSATASDALSMGRQANASAANTIAIGLASTAQAASTIAFGDSNTVAAAAGTGSIAGGHNSQVKGGTGAVALGEGQTVTGNGAVAIGDPNVSNGNGAVTMGANNVAAGDAAGATAAAGAVAIGNNNQAIGQGSVALGNASKALAAGALALGDTATANNAKDVALGSGSTTVTAVGTGSITIGGTVYNFAGTNPTSTVSVGAVGSERTITNVAAGRISDTSTDAINGSQLYATNQAVQAIAASTPLHYYSVNDAGTQQANYINNGATGNNSVAAGVAASASGNRSIAMGFQTQASATQALAIGDGATASGSQATALGVGAVSSGVSGSTAVGANSIASGVNSVAAGVFSSATGATSAAFGPGALAAAARSTAFGPSAQANAASTVSFGDTSVVAAAAGPGSIAGGHNSQVTGGTGAVALGEGQVANGNGAVAIGDPNSAIGTGAVTVGANNTSNGQGAIALGNSNSATGQGSIALGNASTAAVAGGIALGDTANAALGNGVAIGANSIAGNANDVALGAGSTTAAPHTGVTAQFGGTAAGIANAASGVVSVGAGGSERQIQNVAAGVISATSTDAINGSQLNTVVTGINNLGTTTAGTLGGGAAYDPATGNVAGFSQPINTVSATGAVTGPTAQTTVAGALTALNTNVDNTANIAVKYDAVGGSKITLGATGGAGAGAPVTITNLAPAALNPTSTDAVNGSQLYGTNQNVTNLTDGKIGPFVSDNSVTAVQPVSSGANASAGGFGATATGAASTVVGNQATDNGNANATVLGQGASIAAGTAGSNVALGQGSTVAAAAVPTTGATIGGTAYTFAGGAPAGVVSVGSAGNERQITNVAAGQLSGTSTDAVNGSQLFATNTQVTANTTAITNINNGGGIKYFHASSTLADSTATGTDSVAVGPTANASATDAMALGHGSAATNVGAVALGAGSTTTAAVVTTGTTINGTAYNYAGTAPTSTVSIGNVGNERTITNVAAGQVSGTSTDAVNGSQLFATDTAVTSLGNTVNNITNGKAGPFVSDNSVTAVQPVSSGANASAGGFGATATGAASTVVGNQATDNGNANATVLGQGASIAAGTAGSNVALGQGSTVAAAAVPTTGATIGGTAYTFAGGAPAGVVSVGSAGNERQITNVAAGQLSGTSTDAVNGSQLFATNTQVTANTTAITNINNGGGIKYFHASSTLADSTATGTDSVAVGPTANASATDAMALGHGSAATNAGAVALGAGSTTAAAVATTGATINGTTYAFAGAAPTSTVSVGSVGNERTITNVAAGQLSTSSTDAVNGSQLNATNLAIAASKTHYYSVNDGGTQGGNYNNNGATGVDALAAGVGSSAAALNDVAIGNLAAASGGSSIAIGDGAQASGANSISIGTGNIVSGASSVAIGDPTTITGTGSFSVGNNNNIASNNTFVFGSNVTVPTGFDGSVVLGSGSAAAAANPVSSGTVNGTTYGGFAGATPTSTVSVGAVGAERQITNVAAGQLTATSTDAINGSQLYSVASGLGTAISNLSTVVNANQFPIASSEGKAFSGAIGAAGSNSLGMGTNAVATGQNATAAGQGSVANQANTTALGQGAQATAANSTALGQGAVAGTGNSVAIGSASATTAAVATAGTTIRGTAYSFAGGAPVGTVSVGSAGNERQIQNVAAGQLSATSTDAINGSQLYATNSAINNLTNVVTSTQVKYYSDNSSGGGNVNNDGATGADAMAMGKNTTATATNAVAMGPGASATASNGVAIGAGSTADRAGLGGAKESFSNAAVASTQGAVSVGSAGNERQITNVAGGTQATDAVNVRQLQAVQAGGVHYDTNTDGSTNYSSVTMGNGGSSPVAIHNVEAGTAATDAVNVSQLNTGLSSAVQQANQHADGLAMQLQNNINDVAKKAYAGVAAAMSMESAPYVPGKITYSAGYGYYQNQNAIGISLRRTADNGRWALSGGVSGTTSGGVAARLAVSGVLN